MLGTVPLLSSLNTRANERPEQEPNMWRELREGWQEFATHVWVWSTVLYFLIVGACVYGAVIVLGPVIARDRLGGAATWGWLYAMLSVGLILGGLVALRWVPKRPLSVVVVLQSSVALGCWSLGANWPLWSILVAFGLVGVCIEMAGVCWNVALARLIRPDRLARVAAYDGFGTALAMPLGALAAGPLAAHVGPARTEYAAAVLVAVASGLTLLVKDIRNTRLSDAPDWELPEAVDEAEQEEPRNVLELPASR